MSHSPRTASHDPVWGCMGSVLIGIGTIAIVLAAIESFSARTLNLAEEWPFLAFWAALIAAPFGLLAIFRIRRALPWIVGLALTALIWSGLVLAAYLSGRAGSGVNFGYGLLMLISPVIIGAISFATASIGRDQSDTGSRNTPPAS